MLLVVVGIGLAIPWLVAYLDNELALTTANLLQDHLAVTGLAAAIAGAQLFVFVLSACTGRSWPPRAGGLERSA